MAKGLQCSEMKWFCFWMKDGAYLEIQADRMAFEEAWFLGRPGFTLRMGDNIIAEVDQADVSVYLVKALEGGRW